MAVNNNGNLLASDGSVAVDFVWGNFPMQPNDERADSATVSQIGGGSGDYSWSATTKVASTRLNPALSNHAVVEAKYAGFPAFTGNDDGAYVSGTAYIVVPNVLGLTTALAVDALKDAGYEAANITTASAYTPAVNNVSLTSNVATLTTAAAHGFAVGDSVVIAGLTDTTFNGTHTLITGTTGSTLVFALTASDVTSAADSGTAKVAAKAGTIYSQSTAAGASSVATTASITITPYYAS